MIAKIIHKVLLLSIISLAVHGQDAKLGPLGFVRLINAVTIGTGKLDVLIDGKSIRADGYQPGNVTGGIALKPGSHQVVFHREGIKKGETEVQVEQNDTTILIPFAEEIPGNEVKPTVWKIRILRLKQHTSENERTASFVSVSREPEIKIEMRQADGNWQPLLVKRLAVERTEIQQARGYMSVRCGERELSAISVGSSGNFVSVLFEDENGLLCSKTFLDYKFLSAD